jgi:hypothetical protein
MAEPLQEYLISLGFNVDGASQQRMKAAVREGALQANLIFEALNDFGRKFAQVMAQAAGSLENLYYASQRVKDSAANIQAFEGAAARMGSSIEAAGSSLENFAKTLRSKPGFNLLAEQLAHVDDKTWQTMGGVEKLQALVKGTAATEPYSLQVIRQGQFGIDENTWRAIEDPAFAAHFAARETELKALQTQLGFNSKAAEDAKNLENSLRDLASTITTIGQVAEARFFEQYGRDIKKLNEYLKLHGPEIERALENIGAGVLGFVDDLAKLIQPLDKAVDSTTGWTKALEVLMTFMALRMVPGINAMTAAVARLFGLAAPTWFLPLAALAAGWEANKAASGGASTGDLSGRFGSDLQNDIQGWKNLFSSGSPPGLAPQSQPADTRNWWQRTMPTWLGGQNAPSSGRAAAGGAPAPTGAPGTYRPAYTLGAADLDPRVINTIAGEARLSDQRSVDAVINNMLNRVGTTGYGPSANLLQVARAPGQYTGYRVATPEQAAYIQSRIRAIASGSVPDITGGSNEYRADWYHGPWGWNHPNAPDIGGNRFAYNPRVAPGTYAPYSQVGGGAPASAAPALSSLLGITPAQADELRKRAINVPSSSPFGSLEGARNAFHSSTTPPAAPTAGPVDNSKSSTLQQHTELHLYGVGDGHEELGAKLAREQSNINADLIRNLQNASVG